MRSDQETGFRQQHKTGKSDNYLEKLRLTVGDKEEAEKCVSVKCRKDGVMTHIPLAELADYLADKLVRKQ